MAIPASEFLAFLKSNAEATTPPSTLAEFRGQFDGLTAGLNVPAGVQTVNIRLGGVDVLHQKAVDAVSDTIVIYCHGGGYVLGSTQTHSALTAHLALETGGEVYSLDYRLAPENPWPAAIHDVCAVYEELLGKSIPPKQIFFAGDSAGGGLVLSAIVNAKQKQLPMPAGLVLLSPWVDLTNSGWSHDALADRDYVCNSAILTTCAAYYTGGLSPGAGLKSALFADLSDLPPLLIHVGSEEVLLSDSTRLAARAGAAGLRVDLKVWPQMPHVFPLFIEHLAEAAASVREIADWIRGQPVLSD